jgi:hypothetical protein
MSKLHFLNFVIVLKHHFFLKSRYRSAFAKFRCGVAPLRIETGRYENKNVNERVCFICHDQIEDEKHVLLDCPLYADLRESYCIKQEFYR